MNIKKVITAMCATTFIFASSFSNVDIIKINAVAEGVIEEHVDYSDGITYGTYDCGDCIIEYSVGTNRIVVRRITHVTNSSVYYTGGNKLNIPAYINGIPVTIIKDGFADETFGGTITSVIIPDTVTYIGDYAFSGCSHLGEVTIPNSVTSIGEGAFLGCGASSDCSGLTSITIPDSVTSISDYTFSGCTNLESVIIPNSVKSIGYCAFRKCTSLKEVTIPDSVTSIGDSAFCACSSLKSVIMGDSVTNIGEKAFSECPNLKEVELSNNIKELSHTFASCKYLESVTIPEGVTYINEAFDDCLNLKSLIIPESVEAFSFNIGNCADKFSLTILSDDLYIRSTSENGIESMFNGIYNGRIKIYAHENSTAYNTYKYLCYNHYQDNQEEYEKALSKFNIIEDDTDADDDTQWYTVVKSADVNNDGKIDASDASDILKYYAYISTGGELSFKDFTASK